MGPDHKDVFLVGPNRTELFVVGPKSEAFLIVGPNTKIHVCFVRQSTETPFVAPKRKDVFCGIK